MDDKIKEFEGIIEEQTIQIKLLTEQIEYLKKKLYGKSSEKTKIGEGQLDLFEADSFLKQSQLMNKPTRTNMKKK